MNVRWMQWLTGPRYAMGRLIVLLAAGLAGLAGAAFLCQDRVWWRDAATPLGDPLANGNELGVNVDLQQYEPAALARAVADIREAGFHWVRQRFPWSEIEPERGAFEWERWDEIVALCAGHDLALLAVLDGAPGWARSVAGADLSLTPPQEVADWGAFVRAFAARYQGRIAAYQLWDEPNLAGHWGGAYVDPAAYTGLLREGTIQIRDADPGAPVLLAALAPTVENGPLNLNEVDFLRGVIDAGGRPFFDAVALQPYGFGRPPDAKLGGDELGFGRAAQVRRALLQMGLGDVPVWMTAWGWNARSPDRSALWPGVGEAQQAEYTVAALAAARESWPWAGAMILYTYQPDLPPADPRWGFSLLDVTGQPRPVYDALRSYNKEQHPLYTGFYVPNERNASYVGEWRFAHAGADPPHGATAAARNAVASFDFVGAALDVTVRRGDFWGFLYLTVDGRPAGELPRDEQGRAYLILHDPLARVETVPVARGLAATRVHHVEIVAHGGWGQWPLVGWTVLGETRSRPGPGAALWLLLAGGMLLLAAAAQFVLTPRLFRAVYATIGRAFKWYRALPEWAPLLATLGAALGCYFAPWTPVSLLLLALLFALFFLRIDLGLAMVALALPFYTCPKALFGRPFAIIDLLLGLCVAAWLVARALDWGRALSGQGAAAFLADRLLRMRQVRWVSFWRRNALDVGVVALVLAAWLAMDAATYREVAGREFRVVFLSGALFYALIRLSIKSARAQRRLIDGWLLGAVVIAVIGLVQWVSGRNLITVAGASRVRGLYGSPNNLALYLERALPVLLVFAWRPKSPVHRLGYALAGLIVLAALGLTFSKGALLLGVPASVLALVLLRGRGTAMSRWRVVWGVVGLVGLLAVLVAPLALGGRLTDWFDAGSGSGFFRLKLWRATFIMIADHPWLGVGPDNFLYHYRTRYVLPSAWGELDLAHPHNLLLDAWTRLGLPGVAVVGWLVGWFVHTTWGKLAVFGDNRTIVLGLTASMAAVLAHGLVDQAVFLVDLAFVFMLLLAVAQKGDT